MDKESRSSSREAAVIVASRPLEPADAVEGIRGGERDILPALIQAGQASFIERVVVSLQMIGAAPIVVITGYENESLERHLSRMSVVCLHNPGWKEGHAFDDALLGLSYLERTCQACDKIWLSSPLVPFVQKETLTRLLQSDKGLALPLYEGREGLPLVIKKEAVRRLMEERGGRSLEDVAALFPGPVDRMELDDQGVLSSLGQADGEVLEGEGESESPFQPMRAGVKLNLARDRIFFGPGPATLLRLIDETGSVRMACKRMKLSYSKGWQLLNLLEDQLGAQVLDRRPGGQEGGSSSLTPLGRDLLHRFEALVSESQRAVNQFFEEHFQDFPCFEGQEKTQG